MSIGLVSWEATDVVNGEPGYLQVENGCPSVEDMCIGFTQTNWNEEPTLEPTPVLYFNSVDNGSLLEAQFTPVLRA
ncbi:hypothetical protein BS17DRAFT_820310 [Gyrodon lividus]|nr:hypothetical protein BS17DRAFT_820310 [Gyrodon lividus]